MFAFLEQWSRDRFARRLQRRVAAIGGPTDFTYDREKFRLTRPNRVAFLENLYATWRQAAGGRKAQILDHMARSLADSKDVSAIGWDEAQAILVAAVRECAFLATMDGPAWGIVNKPMPEKRPIQAPISSWFAQALVLDFPTHVAVVNEEHLKQWNVTEDEAFTVGLRHLRAATAAKFNQVEGYYVGGWNDDYDASRVLVPAIFDDLPLDGAPVVCLPNRLTLMVAGENQHDAIRAMLKKAEEIVQTIAKPQNPAPLVIREGRLRDFEVGPDSPIFNEVQRAKKFAALRTYSDQKANLARYYQEAGKDIHVAAYNLVEMKAGGYESYCVWSRGVPSLLPVADVVMFASAGADPKSAKLVAKVRWADVVRVLEPLLLDTKMFPPRYYVSQFPTEEQFRAMGATPQTG